MSSAPPSPSPSSEDYLSAPTIENIQHARNQALRLWSIPQIRQIIMEFTMTEDLKRIRTVNRASFDTWAAVTFRVTHMHVYQKLVQRLLPKFLIDTCVRSIDTLDITGVLPALGHMPDLFAFFEVIPTLRAVSWSTGILRRDRRSSLNEPTFERDSIWTVKTPKDRKWDDATVALPYDYTARFPVTVRYRVILRHPRKDCSILLQKVLDLAATQSVEWRITELAITLSGNPQQLVDSISDHSVMFGWMTALTVHTIDCVLDAGDLNALTSILPDTCRRLEIRLSSKEDNHFDMSIVELIDWLRTANLKSLRFLVLPVVLSQPPANDLHFFDTIRPQGRLFKMRVASADAPSALELVADNERLANVIDLQLCVHGWVGQSGSPHFRAGQRGILPFSVIAAALFKLGGPYSRYRLQIGGYSDLKANNDVLNAHKGVILHSEILTRQLLDEMYVLEEKDRRAEIKGWRKLGQGELD